MGCETVRIARSLNEKVRELLEDACRDARLAEALLAGDGGLVLARHPRDGSAEAAAAAAVMLRETMASPGFPKLNRIPEREAATVLTLESDEGSYSSLVVQASGRPFLLVAMSPPGAALHAERTRALRDLGARIQTVIERHAKALCDLALEETDPIRRLVRAKAEILDGLTGAANHARIGLMLDEEGFVVSSAEGTDADAAEELAALLARLVGDVRGFLKDLRTGTIHGFGVVASDGCLVVARSPIAGAHMALLSRDPQDFPAIQRELEFVQAAVPAPEGEARPDDDGLDRVYECWEHAGTLRRKGKYMRSTGGKLFHYPDCSTGRRIKDARVRWIPTRAEALRKKLRPCARCGS